MKICIDGLPFFANKWDLGEYSRELILNLSKEPSVSLYLLKDKEIQRGIESVNYRDINICNIAIDRVNDNYLPIQNCLKKNNIEIYHCLNNGFSLGDNMNEFYVITTFHSIVPLEYEDYYKEVYIKKFFNSLSKALRNTNKFIVPSNSMKNKLMTLCNVPKKNIEVVYPIISKKFQPMNKYMSQIYLRSKFNINEDFILFSGDFHKRKRIEELVEMFFRLSNVRERIKLIFLTAINEVNIDYFNEVKSLINSMNLNDKIQFITTFTKDDKVHFFNTALCFVDFSIYDDMNVSMIQALKCKCPIICSDIALHKEIISECGIFVDIENAHSWDYIEKCILNISDIQLYNQSNYIDSMRKFDVFNNVNKLVDIYNCRNVY